VRKVPLGATSVILVILFFAAFEAIREIVETVAGSEFL